MQQHYFTKGNNYIAPYSIIKEDWGYCHYYFLARLDKKHSVVFTSDVELSEDQINEKIEESFLCS